MELTEAGAELQRLGRRLLADLDGTVARVRMVGRGQAGLVRIGVAHLAEPVVAPALTAFQAEHASVVVDRSAMVSGRLLEQLAGGRLHAAVVHQVPALATVDQVMSEPLRRGRLAVLAGPHSTLAGRHMVTLAGRHMVTRGELSNQTFLANPRALAPGAFRRPHAHVREFGGFEANVLESAAASTVALDTDSRPIRDGKAIALMAETTARALRADGIAPSYPSSRRSMSLPWPGGTARRPQPTVPGLVPCQNPARRADLLFYAWRSCSSDWSICSWSECSAGWRCWRGATP